MGTRLSMSWALTDGDHRHGNRDGVGARKPWTTCTGTLVLRRGDRFRARGGAVRLLTQRGFEVSEPDWSRTGKIAFIHRTGWREETLEVYTMSSDGSGHRRLTRNRDAEASPAWSPDGRRIAFHSGTGLFVMNADGSSARRLTRNPEDHSPAWSPDGNCIAFGRGGRDIYVIGVAGGAPRLLINEKHAGSDRAPAWSSNQ